MSLFSRLAEAWASLSGLTGRLWPFESEQTVKILLVVMAGIGTVCWYFWKRSVESGPLKESLEIESLRLDNELKKMRLDEMLSEVRKFDQNKGASIERALIERYHQWSEFPAKRGATNVLCYALTEKKLVRAEGIAELLNPAVLAFWAPPTKERVTSIVIDIEITFNVNVTNSVGSHYIGSEQVDIAGAYVDLGADRIDDERIRRGRIVSRNKLRFEEIPVVIDSRTGSKVLRIENIRVNASQVGSLESAMSAGKRGKWSEQDFVIAGLISVEESGSHAPIEVLNELLAFARPYLGAFRWNGGSAGDSQRHLIVGQSHNEELLTSDIAIGTPDVLVTLREGVPDSFRGALKERGYQISNPNERVGGTRILLTIENVPPGLRAFAAITDVPRTKRAVLEGANLLIVDGADSSGDGGRVIDPQSLVPEELAVANGVALRPVALSNGFGVVCWEWVRNGLPWSGAIDSVTLGIAFAGRPTEPGFIQLRVGLAPMSTNVTALASLPLPRFLGFLDPGEGIAVLRLE